MRSLFFAARAAFAATIALASVTGCGGEARSAMAEPKAPMAESVGGRASSAPRDREVEIADRAFKKSADAPAPAPVTTPASPAAPATGNMFGEESKAEPTANASALNRDFVIYTAHYVMAVYQVDKGIAEIERIAREAGGYLAIKKDREITVRIPRARFEAAVASVDKIGDVLHRDIAAEDVTDQHVDLEVRIKNARAMQKQLTALLAKANVKEALEIEKELGRVTEELERLEGHLKLLSDRIAFSTITVTFEPRGTTLQTQRVRLPFPWMSALNLPTLLNLSEEK